MSVCDDEINQKVNALLEAINVNGEYLTAPREVNVLFKAGQLVVTVSFIGEFKAEASIDATLNVNSPATDDKA